MKSHKKSHKINKLTRRNKKGGYFFNKPTVVSSTECDVNNLSTISKDMGDGQDPLVKMQNNYKICCPKGFMGKKNSSPYCKQLEMNFNSLYGFNKSIEGYYGDETDPAKIKEIMDQPVAVPVKKPWYQFWGGKKTRKHRKHRKRSNRRK